MAVSLTPYKTKLEELKSSVSQKFSDEETIENTLTTFVDGLAGKTDDERRINLPLMKKLTHEATDYLRKSGLTVQGSVVRPVLYKLIDDAISKLPEKKDELNLGGK